MLRLKCRDQRHWCRHGDDRSWNSFTLWKTHSSGFILIDKMTNATVAGLINFVSRAQNIHWQATVPAWSPREPEKTKTSSTVDDGLSDQVNPPSRMRLKNWREWNVTHSCSMGTSTYGLNKIWVLPMWIGLKTFGVCEAKLMTDAGLIVITAFISFRSERQMVRDMMAPANLLRCLLIRPCLSRKNGMSKASMPRRSGQLKNFTGIDSPYEALKPQKSTSTQRRSIDEAEKSSNNCWASKMDCSIKKLVFPVGVLVSTFYPHQKNAEKVVATVDKPQINGPWIGDFLCVDTLIFLGRNMAAIDCTTSLRRRAAVNNQHRIRWHCGDLTPDATLVVIKSAHGQKDSLVQVERYRSRGDVSKDHHWTGLKV